MADRPDRTELSQVSMDNAADRTFALVWTSFTLGLLALLMGIAGWAMLMR